MILDLTALFIIILVLIITAALFIRILKRKFFQLSSQNRLLKALSRLDQVALTNTELKPLYQGIVDVIHEELGFTFAILAIIDKTNRIIRREAISLDKGSAEFLHNLLPVKFDQQIISFDNVENLFIKAMNEKKAKYTKELADIQIGVLSPEISKKIQRIWHLKSVFLYPILIKDEVVGVIEYSSTKSKEEHLPLELSIMEEFTFGASRALENAFLYQKLKQTTSLLEKANIRLQELDKLKDDFVSVASHELRTPMTAIRSYAWMALHRSDVPLSQKMERYLYRTLISTERLINLVNDMLNVSRIEAGKIEVNPEPFDIAALVADVVEEVKAKADEKRLQFQVLNHPVPKVFADPDKVHQVLLNLVGNSLKFTYPGGIISIGYFTDGKVLEVSIKDNGSGISKEDLSKLFHKFARLDNSYVSLSTSGGTGLGLYISKILIEEMQGKIWAESEGVDKGATFSFSLPLANEETLKNAKNYKVEVQGEAKPLEPVAI